MSITTDVYPGVNQPAVIFMTSLPSLWSSINQSLLAMIEGADIVMKSRNACSAQDSLLLVKMCLKDGADGVSSSGNRESILDQTRIPFWASVVDSTTTRELFSPRRSSRAGSPRRLETEALHAHYGKV